jgi:hypothetical protein
VNHTPQTRTLTVALSFTLFFVVGRLTLTACSISISGHEEVSDHFVVKVVTLGKPVTGLNLELRTIPLNRSKRGRLVSSGITDENGLAAFVAVRAGYYSVDIKHNTFPSSTTILARSHSRKSTHETITIEWPNIEILHVQSIAGLLNGQIKTGNPFSDQTHPVVVPLSGAKLTLLEAVSENIVDSQTASDSGAFSFGSAASGLFLLHVEATENPETHQIGYDGYIPIEIDSSANAPGLNLSIFPPMCGALIFRNAEGVTAE